MTKRRRSLLVIDDDRACCTAISDHLSSESLEILAAHTLSEGLTIVTQRMADVVLLDQKLPDGNGETLCPAILEKNENTKIIFITAFPNFEHALQAIRTGAHDYLSKPFELGELELAVRNALRTAELERVEQFEKFRARKDREDNVLIGTSNELREVHQAIELAASVDAPVLITGETGTGKNLVARTIHHKGPRSQAPFVSINCAAIPENLIETEMFGCEKGAYTGANTTRKGIFEMADGGTLLLDEIGEMPSNLQSKLLGVLEDGVIRRIGGQSARPVFVRVIAATNTVLDGTSEKMSLREDLYYRLNVLRIHIPPLRDRRHDIPDLCNFLLRKFRRGREFRLPENEMNLLTRYDWPGNVRELRNILERSVLVQNGDSLYPSKFLPKKPTGSMNCPATSNGIPTLGEVQKQHILSTFERLGGNYTRTAKALAISLSTLKRKMKSFSCATTDSD